MFILIQFHDRISELYKKGNQYSLICTMDIVSLQKIQIYYCQNLPYNSKYFINKETEFILPYQMNSVFLL